MPKLPPWLALVEELTRKRLSIGLKEVCAASGELGRDPPLDCSKSRFAGDEMIESDVMRLDMTSGDAGVMWMRFGSDGL